MTLQAIATTGENAYVLVTEENASQTPIPQDMPARVLDTRAGELHPTMYLGSIMTHNPYIEPVNLDVEETQKLLREAGVNGTTIGGLKVESG